MTPAPLAVSVVVVAYDMAREIPRTLRSLGPGYQQGIAADDYEVVLVDNGSPEPLDAAMLGSFAGRLRTMRIDPAPPTPARAANLGIEMAESDFVGVLVDGARLASPGLLALACTLRAPSHRGRSSQRSGWHLGAARHMDAEAKGYDQAAEDRAPRRDGLGARRLSAVLHQHAARRRRRAVVRPDGGEQRAVHGESRCGRSSVGSTSASRCRAADSRTTISTAGRASSTDAQLVVLLGEGTFHQIHGGRRNIGPLRLGRDARGVREAARPRVPAADERAAVSRIRSPTRRCPTWSSRRSGRSSCARLTRRRNGLAQSFQKAAGVERERVLLERRVDRPVVVVGEDALDGLARPRAESGPYRVAVQDRVLDDHVGADGHQRRVHLELRFHPEVRPGLRSEHDEHVRRLADQLAYVLRSMSSDCGRALDDR